MSMLDGVPLGSKVRVTLDAEYVESKLGDPGVILIAGGRRYLRAMYLDTLEYLNAEIEVVSPEFGVGDLVKTADGEYGLVASPPRPSSFVNKPPVVSVKFDDNGEPEIWSTEDLVIIVKAIGGES